jgi:hypothetical protein
MLVTFEVEASVREVDVLHDRVPSVHTMRSTVYCRSSQIFRNMRDLRNSRPAAHLLVTGILMTRSLFTSPRPFRSTGGFSDECLL